MTVAARARHAAQVFEIAGAAIAGAVAEIDVPAFALHRDNGDELAFVVRLIVEPHLAEDKLQSGLAVSSFDAIAAVGVVVERQGTHDVDAVFTEHLEDFLRRHGSRIFLVGNEINLFAAQPSAVDGLLLDRIKRCDFERRRFVVDFCGRRRGRSNQLTNRLFLGVNFGVVFLLEGTGATAYDKRHGNSDCR